MSNEEMTKARENYLNRDFSKLSRENARINVYLDVDLKEKFKDYCKATNISMNALLITLIHKYLYEALLFETK